LLGETGFSDIGLLSIDIDGNDAHILAVLDLTVLNPAIIIVEYNAIFGSERTISVPYDKNYARRGKHYSNLFFGSSLAALNHIANKKGYGLVCCSLAGNNAYFVRRDLLNERINEKAIKDVFKVNKFRESRNLDNTLSFLDENQRYELIKGMDVINIVTNEMEKL
jgi:hypothetical protein